MDVEGIINRNIDALNFGLNNLGNGRLINNIATSSVNMARDFMNSNLRTN